MVGRRGRLTGRTLRPAQLVGEDREEEEEEDGRDVSGVECVPQQEAGGDAAIQPDGLTNAIVTIGA